MEYISKNPGCPSRISVAPRQFCAIITSESARAWRRRDSQEGVTNTPAEREKIGPIRCGSLNNFVFGRAQSHPDVQPECGHWGSMRINKGKTSATMK